MDFTAQEALGVLAGVMGMAMAAGPLLQLRRMHVLQSSEDVSAGYLSIVLAGALAWTAYGLSLGNLALIVPNACGSAVAAATLLFVLRLRRGQRDARAGRCERCGRDGG